MSIKNIDLWLEELLKKQLVKPDSIVYKYKYICTCVNVKCHLHFQQYVRKMMDLKCDQNQREDFSYLFSCVMILVSFNFTLVNWMVEGYL